MNRQNKKKTISRKFWSYLNYLPPTLRAKLIRSQFEIEYELPKELVFKQAETVDEITQALRIVYDSYIDLNYMDDNTAKMRVTKYHALPTTVILIAKYGDEVVGTLTIISNSALGIPSEMTWNLDKFKKNGQQIAEISSLSIKKGFRKQRGKLLLPLCKLMYQFSTQILQLDGIIVSTVIEVEPFYTDILLFEKIATNAERENLYAKGTPCTCCYLELNQNTVLKYKKIFGKKNKIFNLYHFFIEVNTDNIQVPDIKRCIQAFNIKQNISLAEILKDYPALINDFTEKDKMILKNIDISDTLPIALNEINSTYNRGHKRYCIKQKAWLYDINKKSPVPIFIVDISASGLKIILSESTIELKKDAEVLIFFEFSDKIVQLNGKISWINTYKTFGFEILTYSETWKEFSEMIFSELTNKGTEYIFKDKKTG